MQCPKCKLEISEDSKFCPNCGVEISKYRKESIDTNPKILNVKSDMKKRYDYYLSLKIDPKVIERDKQIGKNKYLRYNSAEYKSETTNSDDSGCLTIFVFIAFIGWAICHLLDIECPFGILFVVSTIISGVYFIMYELISSSSQSQEVVDILKELKNRVDEHNKNFITTTASKLLEENGVTHISKEIMLTRTIDRIEKIVVDESSSTFLLVDVNCTCPTSRTYTQKALFSEILRYAFLDKSTSTQTATSKTSSNSGKALGGAVVSKLLVDDATAGAVIGGSGGRVTETTYKTTVNRKYQITIYLNRLEDSVITIITSSGNATNEIIATLEYILNKKGK